MKVGTKSLLFGVHQFILHPLFVLWAWIKLYGWRTLNFPILVAIIIHDWGLWSCEKMDDEKGEEHPLWAAKKMSRVFKQSLGFYYNEEPDDNWYWNRYALQELKIDFEPVTQEELLRNTAKYGFQFIQTPLIISRHKLININAFVKYHSRFLAKKDGARVSPLCLADKLGSALYPVWLWVFLAKLSGELWEYMGATKYEINNMGPQGSDYRKPEDFFRDYKKICDKWVSGEVSLEPWRD